MNHTRKTVLFFIFVWHWICDVIVFHYSVLCFSFAWHFRWGICFTESFAAFFPSHIHILCKSIANDHSVLYGKHFSDTDLNCMRHNSWGNVSCLSKEKMMQFSADLPEIAYIFLRPGNWLKIHSVLVLVCN